MATKTILKLTPLHCVVKISNSTNVTDTITLNSDLVYGSREVVLNPIVNILGVYWSIPGATAATIKRNSVQIYTLIGSWNNIYNGFSDIQEHGSDIVVDLPSGGGVIILELLKKSGYNNNQHLNSEI